MLTAIRRIPLLRLLLPFLVGLIGCAFLLEVTQLSGQLSIWLTIVGAILVGISMVGGKVNYARRWVFGVIMQLAFVLFGASTVIVNSPELFDQSVIGDDGEAREWLITILEQPVEKANSVKMEVDAVARDECELSGKVLIYLQKSESAIALKSGEQLLIRAGLNPITTPGNPHEFNYARYLRFHGIFRQAYVTTDRWIRLPQTEKFNFWFGVANLRATLLDRLDSTLFAEQERAIVAALTLGYKQELDPETTRAFAGAGAMHVLAVSGLHVGILYTMIMIVFAFLTKVKNGDLIRATIVILLLVSYAALTGMSASVFRAATMFSFVAWAKASKRYSNIYNTLTASAFVLLLFDPYLIMQVGFQLSYAAVLGIVFIHPWLFSLLVFKNRILDWTWNITCVSIAAQIATFPLGLLYFHQFPNYFLFSNWVVIPLATVIMYAGLAFFAFGWIEVLTQPLAFILKWLAYGLNEFVRFVEALPFSMLQEIDISILETVLIYLIIISVFILLMDRSFKMVYLSFTSIALLLLSQISETAQQQNQQELIIYNVRKGFALDLISGNDHLFLANQKLLADKNSMLFHVEHHWWAKGLNVPKVVTMDSSFLLTGYLFDWNGKRIWVSPATPNTHPKEPVDNFIVSSIGTADWTSVLSQVKASQIIVGQNNDHKSLKRLKRICDDLGVKCLSVRETGPQIL